MTHDFHESEILENLRKRRAKSSIQDVIDGQNADKQRQERGQKKLAAKERRAEKLAKFRERTIGRVTEHIERKRAEKAFQADCQSQYDAYMSLYDESKVGSYQTRFFEAGDGTKGVKTIIHTPRGPIVINHTTSTSGERSREIQGYFTLDNGKTYMYGKAIRWSESLGYSIAGVGAERYGTKSFYRDENGKFVRCRPVGGVNAVYIALDTESERKEYKSYREIDEPIKE